MLALVLAAGLTTAPDPGALREKVRAYRVAHEAEILREFVELLRLPNHAADPHGIERNADRIGHMLEERGFRTRMLMAESGPPAVFGELATPGAKRTVIFYAHYDGQPVDPAQWTGEPFTPVLRDRPLEEGGREVPIGTPTQGEWRLYARSASDDKAPVDDDLRRSLGLAATEAGGARLVERIMLPALNLRGLAAGHVGAQAANAIPTEARASIDFRLVPDQTPANVRERFEEHLRQQGYFIVHEAPDLETRRSHERIVKLDWGPGYPAARTPLDLTVSRAVIRVVQEAQDMPIVVMPTLGGSIPMHLFGDILKTSVIGVPIANHDNNQHGANENIRLQNLWDGIEVYAALLARLSDWPSR